MTFRALILLPFFALAGCNGELEEAWTLKHFRIFGVYEEAPEAAPGDTVHLRLDTFDPQSRPVQAGWLFCARLQRAGNSLTCDPTATTVMTGTEVDYVVPMGNYGVDPLNQPRIQVTGFACAGGTVAFDLQRGPHCNEPDAEGRAFLRSIEVRTDTSHPPNHNPHIADVLFDGTSFDPMNPPHVPRCPFESCPEHIIELRPTADSWEVYSTIGLDGRPVDGPERLQFLYSTTRGTFDGAFRVDTAEHPSGPIRNTWKAPATAGPVTFVFTVQDPRGGYDFAQKTLIVD